MSFIDFITSKAMIFVFVFIFVVYSFVTMFIGIPIETTTNGHHTGIVTAIEDNGIIWKTTTVYFKTSSYTSQEETYCLRKDSQTYESDKKILTDAVATSQKVELGFKSFYSVPITQCNSENAFITSVNLNITQEVVA